MTMFAVWPLVTRRRIVHAFKPGASPTAEAPFRTLRRHGWASSGVRVSRYSGRNLAGQLTVFSSLNVIAARLARRGDDSGAERVARAAADLERGTEFVLLQQLLADLRVEEAEQVVDGVLPPDALVALADAIRAVASRTERVKASNILLSSPAEVVFAGQIAEVHETFVLLATPRGATTVLPRWLARAADRDHVGAYLALVTDRLDVSSAVVEAVPAIDVEDAAGASEFSPFDRGDARLQLITGADARLLDGEPQLRILFPVQIDG